MIFKAANSLGGFRVIFCLTILAITCAMVSGCGESFYDSAKPVTASEHLGDINSRVDLFWTLHQHGFAGAVLAGCRPSRLYPGREDTPEEIARINGVAMDLAKAASKVVTENEGRFIYPFPMIDVDDPDPLTTAKMYFESGDAFGIALDPIAGQELFSDKMRALYDLCELSRAPLFLHFDASRFEDLRRFARDYPHIIFIVPQLAGKHDDLPALHSLLMQHNNIYLGFGFGPEDVMIEKMEVLAKDTAGLKKFIEAHQERICFATETNLTEEPYRNSTLAESQVRFMRRFIEKDIAGIKFKGRDGKWKERELPGLSLDKQLLGYIYRLNIMRAVTERPPFFTSYNLNVLQAGVPEGTTFDEKSELRLIPAVVVNVNHPFTGLASTQLRKLLTGDVTDFDILGLAHGRIELVSRGPLAEWIARKLEVKLRAKVKRIDNREAFVDYMFKHPQAVGFCAFDDLDPRLRAITVDGETPINSYIKYCAAKGAGTYSYYFDTYPLLIPVTVPKDKSAAPFDPHKMRRICITGPATFGPFDPGGDAWVTAQRPTIELAPVMRDSGLTLTAFSGEARQGCEDDNCSDQEFLPGILATGIDAHVGTKGEWDELFAENGVSRLSPDHPISRSVRGMQMALVGGNVTANDLSTLVATTKELAAKGVVAAALWAEAEDFETLAPALQKAGAAGVVNVKENRILPWTVTADGMIAPGIGAPFVPKKRESLSAVMVMVFYEGKLIALDPSMADCRSGKARFKAGNFAIDALAKLLGKAAD